LGQNSIAVVAAREDDSSEQLDSPVVIRIDRSESDRHSRARIAMIARLVLTVAATMMFGPVAFADYYIIQEKTTKQCKVVDTMPKETTWLQVGPLKFTTRDEADKQVSVVCKEKSAQ
jgi:hypothetical protein